MTNPFPGMNPYLEGDLWSDVHSALISKIRQLLVPVIRPKYVARIERYVVEDTSIESELGIMYPDVEILKNKNVEEPASHYHTASLATPVSVSIPIPHTIPVRIPYIQIKDVKDNRLITVIEILSPVNKRAPGLKPYLKKKRKLHKAGVHLLEIDLLRRGQRTVQHPSLNPTEYLVALTLGTAKHTDIWSVPITNRLPIVPVPLDSTDKAVLLDIQKALNTIFEEADYGLSIDYREVPTPPALSSSQQEWCNSLNLYVNTQ